MKPVAILFVFLLILCACAPFGLQSGETQAIISTAQQSGAATTPNVVQLSTATALALAPTATTFSLEPQPTLPGLSLPTTEPTKGSGRPRTEPMGTPVRLAPAPTATPLPSAALPDGETLQHMLVTSHENWSTIFAEAKTTWYSGDPANTIRSEERVQVWIKRPFYMLAISGPRDGAPQSLWAADGRSYLLPGSTVQVFPEYITNPPPVIATDPNGIPPSPPESFIPNPLVDLIYPIGLASRPGTYAPVGSMLIAGRPAYILEYTPAGASNRLDRFWLDAQTGVLLGWQNFTKPDGRYLSAETMFTAIAYDIPLPDSLFTLDAHLPADFAQRYDDTAGFQP